MSAALDPEMPETRYIDETSNIVQSAAHVAEKARRQADRKGQIHGWLTE